MRPEKRHPWIKRYFLAGLVAIIPLWITWAVISFLFRTISGIGTPVVAWLSELAEPRFPALTRTLESTAFQSLAAFILVILFVYLLGWLTARVIGRKLIGFFERLLDRIPFVKSVYGSVKKLVTVLQERPGGDTERVVLIDFPSSKMKTVGLVTRILKDHATGRDLAAVYVPTTPNPTSGFLEIVPVEHLTSTNWTMDEAMAFIISGGAIAPEAMTYDKPSSPSHRPEEKE